MVIAGDGLKILIWEFEQEIPSSLMILFGISFFMDFRLLIELPLFCFIGVYFDGVFFWARIPFWNGGSLWQ